MADPTLTLTRELVDLACRAPSTLNTQPWRWRVPDAHTVELYADRSRQLSIVDPDGRDLAISCGAALHHLVVAAEGNGVGAHVTLLPSADDRDFLARIELSASTTSEAGTELLAALRDRATDRQGFTTWEVPRARLQQLCEAAEGVGIHAVPIVEPKAQYRAIELLDQAKRAQEADEHLVAEQETWIDHGSSDGVPAGSAVPGPRMRGTTTPNRFEADSSEPSGPDEADAADAADEDPADGLLAICTVRDDQDAWLSAGQAMSAIWLRAVLGGLAVLPASQVIEVESTRRLLSDEVLPWLGYPQILLEIGWRAVTQAPTMRSPRRSLEDVLIP